MKLKDLSEKLDDFDHFYNIELKPILDELEIKRKAAYSTFIKVALMVGAILIVAAIMLENFDQLLFLGVPAFLIVGYFYRKMAAIRTQAKYVIMPEICERLGLTYQRKPKAHATDIFKNLSLVPNFDEKKLEDEVFGAIEDVNFNLFEAKLIRVSRDSKGRTSRTTIFKGLLGDFDFHKNFKSTTVISGDMTALGNFLSGWARDGERVKLEDPQFENEFEVYSTDQVEARYLLTPTFMQRILKFNQMPTIDALELAFHDGHLFMSIKREENYFEGGGYDLNDPKHVQENIKDIAFIFDIVTILKLTQNTRV